MIRNLEISDIPTVASFDRDFEFPDLQSKLYMIKKVALHENKIIAAAFLRITSEGILVADHDCSEYERTKAILQLVTNIKIEAVQKGLSDCHIFVAKDNEKFRKFATKLGFKDCRDPAMVMQYEQR
jgi:hypothetical protein